MTDLAPGIPAAEEQRPPVATPRVLGRPLPARYAALWARAVRLVRFGLVGASGIVVNEAALAAAVHGTDLPLWLGPILATQVSTVWNFALVELWAFRESGHTRSGRQRFGMFWLVNNVALAIRGPIIAGLSAGLGMSILYSNLVSLLVLIVGRFLVADSIIWKAPGALALEERDVIAAEALAPLLQPPDTAVDGEIGVIDLRDDPRRPAPRPVGEDEEEVAPERPAGVRPGPWHLVALGAVVGVATAVRVWTLNLVGFNSDEIVYVGQGASISGDPAFTAHFPIFRAHPLLFQSLLSIIHPHDPSDHLARFAAAAFGVATVLLVFAIGRRMFDWTTGLVAAGVLALMPYHVAVSRQVLLDGPMVFFVVLAVYALVRYVQSERPLWLYATGAGLAFAFLTKETAVVCVGVVALFLALTPTVKVKVRHLALSGALFGAMAIVFPLAIRSSRRSDSGHNFLVWQLVRRPNHTFTFYAEVVPPALGWLVLTLAVLGGVAVWRGRTWREVLLLSWVAVPVAFFELWPVKGFQYLLPIAPAVALLAACGGVRLVRRVEQRTSGTARLAVASVGVLALCASLAVPVWRTITPSRSGELLAGSGGLPGGREAGHWVADNTPDGSVLLALGPSMANVLEYYGRRQAYGLSVSTNPLHRNPVYVPLDNPDLALREGRVQYLVWDSYTSGRTSFYTSTLMRYVHRYHGRVVHVTRVDPSDPGSAPAIVVYEVRP